MLPPPYILSSPLLKPCPTHVGIAGVNRQDDWPEIFIHFPPPKHISFAGRTDSQAAGGPARAAHNTSRRSEVCGGYGTGDCRSQLNCTCPSGRFQHNTRIGCAPGHQTAGRVAPPVKLAGCAVSSPWLCVSARHAAATHRGSLDCTRWVVISCVCARDDALRTSIVHIRLTVCVRVSCVQPEACSSR